MQPESQPTSRGLRHAGGSGRRPPRPQSRRGRIPDQAGPRDARSRQAGRTRPGCSSRPSRTRPRTAPRSWRSRSRRSPGRAGLTRPTAPSTGLPPWSRIPSGRTARGAWVFLARDKTADAVATLEQAALEALEVDDGEEAAVTYMNFLLKLTQMEAAERVGLKLAARWPRDSWLLARAQSGLGRKAEAIDSCRIAAEAATNQRGHRSRRPPGRRGRARSGPGRSGQDARRSDPREEAR